MYKVMAIREREETCTRLGVHIHSRLHRLMLILTKLGRWPEARSLYMWEKPCLKIHTSSFSTLAASSHEECPFNES